MKMGYRTTGWTVDPLARYLADRYDCPISPRILRMFPPLRYVWAWRGQQAEVPITGENAKRVLFGSINLRTGHRILLRRKRARQEDFQAFLRELRRRYRNRPIWLLLDQAGCHLAAKSQALAAELNIELVWLPKQSPQLNGMDHLWKEVKKNVSANRQYRTIDGHARQAGGLDLRLSPRRPCARRASCRRSSGCGTCDRTFGYLYKMTRNGGLQPYAPIGCGRQPYSWRSAQGFAVEADVRGTWR